MRMPHSGLDFSKLKKKINTYKSIGENGLIKMKKRKILRRDLEELIPHKCKVLYFLLRLWRF